MYLNSPQKENFVPEIHLFFLLPEVPDPGKENILPEMRLFFLLQEILAPFELRDDRPGDPIAAPKRFQQKKGLARTFLSWPGPGT
jgi:hypothetical protein